MSLFEVRNLSAGYGAKHVIDNLSFRLESGRILGVLGANGSGKSTLLKSLTQILKHKGECLLDYIRLEDLGARRISRLLGYIPQRSGISIDICALDVVLMGFNPVLGLLEHPSKEMKAAAYEALRHVGIEEFSETNFLHLSEGQKQLCILARTLVMNAKLLILDEPESALDFRFRYRLLDMIRHNIKSGGLFSVVALHDPMLALNCCDELLLLKDGRNIGLLNPDADSFGHMEEMLGLIYGNVSLSRIMGKSGKNHIVMLREE